MSVSDQTKINIFYWLTAGKLYDWIMNLNGTISAREDLMDKLAIRKTDKVIEVGVGTGLNFEYYPKEVGGYTVDINPRMIRKAKKRAKKYGLTNLEFIEADAASLNFKNNYFDIGIITYALSAIPKNKEALNELKRVVKGKIGIIDFEAEGDPMLGQVDLDLDSLVLESALKITYNKKYRLFSRPSDETVQSVYVLQA